MKHTVVKIYFLFFFVLSAVPSLAQRATAADSVHDPIATFEKGWTDKKFPLFEDLKGLPNCEPSLLNAKAIMVFMGFSGCHPCQHQLPFLLEFAKEQPHVVFVYLTFDPLETFKDELERLHLNIDDIPNFFFASEQRAKIRHSGLDGFGYPQAYFVNKKGVIKVVESGGHPDKGYLFCKSMWLKKLLLAQ
jgi:thiol-disulfide isomerase/thioredoxin